MKRKVELTLFNRTQAAKYLGVDRSYINTLVENGELSEIQLPFRSTIKGRRIPKKLLDDFIDRGINLDVVPNEGIKHLLDKYGISKD
ncbi:MAG: excisionase family DNA-binding protein [Ignavibacteriae bacterium]|nr:excisionase family DNA-binding protein [Ignavibacteriota bacterium]MCB0753269.1 excisionase family DNA-binding protein [Ignavibacteriota bacterium]